MNCGFKSRTLSAALLAICLSLAGFTSASAYILTANFDDLTAGSQGTSFSDGGISFLNLYEGDTNLSPFAVQTTTTVISGFGTGTNVPNNYLTFGGYQPGNAVTFGALSSVTINFPGTASAASLYIAFQGDTSTTNTLTFEALNGTNIVTSQTLAFNTNGFALTSDPFSLSGSFTSLKFLVSGLRITLRVSHPFH